MTSIRSRCPLSLDQFSLNLESLLESGDHSDVTICIGDTEFTAHKAILSAVSPVFAAMFAHAETKEAQEGEVTIEDVDVDTFDVMLQCIYSGHNPDKEQLTEELLVLSDKVMYPSCVGTFKFNLVMLFLAVPSGSPQVSLRRAPLIGTLL